MDYITISRIMSGITEVIGNIFIVGGVAGLVVLGRAIYKTYWPEGLGIFNEEEGDKEGVA